MFGVVSEKRMVIIVKDIQFGCNARERLKSRVGFKDKIIM